MIAAIAAVSYWYPNSSEPALRDASLVVEEGSSWALSGPSGGGKSTLLRLFNGLIPQFYGGRLSGAVHVAGLDACRTPTRQLAGIVGMVFQEPEAQAIADTVEEEVAFGLEQQGCPPAEMARRVDDVLERLGLGPLRDRRLAALSGGERQRVAIAAALALQPRLLVLDEPTSQIDPAGAETVFALLAEARRQLGIATIIAEHRLERVLPAAEAVAQVSAGVVRTWRRTAALAELDVVPEVVELGRRLGLDPLPVTVEEARHALRTAGLRPTVRTRVAPSPAGAPLVEVAGLTVMYGAIRALSEVDLTVREGEVVVLGGPNGSGKTSLLRAVAGSVPLVSGAIRLAGRAAPARVRDRTAIAGMVPQDPALALYQRSVEAEVSETCRFRGISAAGVLDCWNVGDLGRHDPRDISVGQQQRVAVAAMLAHSPRVWMLDEPTRGADAGYRGWLAARLRAHAEGGGAAIVSTHDITFAAMVADRVVGLEGGKVAFDLPARVAFRAGGPLATQVAQVVPGALLACEVDP